MLARRTLAGLLVLAPLVASATDLLPEIRAHVGRATSPFVAWRPVTAHGQLRPALLTPVPDTANLDVTMPPAARLRFGIAVLDHWFGKSTLDGVGAVRFAVSFTDESGAATALFERIVDLRGGPGDRRWIAYDLDLATLAGRRGTLRLASSVVGDPGKATFALWHRPILYADVPSEDRGPNLLLVTIDALRADHLRTYGHVRETTPHLDRLAEEGVRFAHAFTNAPMTFPSLPQLLTSAHYPTLVSPTLTTSLFAGGFRHTRAIVHNPYLEIWLEYLAHDSFDSVLPKNWNARHISDAALEWIDTLGDAQWGLYLHFLDTHTPYGIPEPDATHFVDASYAGTIGRRFADVEGAKAGKYDEADRRRIVELYDGAIYHTDRQVGRVLDGLRERGLLDRTLVVVTADHGEELWDHGSFFHGGTLYDEQLHVPLIMRLPGGAHAGTVVDAQVPLLDVLPTIAEVLDVPVQSGMEGQSLMPLVRGKTSEERPVFARASNVGLPQRFALRSGGYKVIETLHPQGIEAFDLRADPKEQRDVSADPAHQAMVRSLTTRLERYRAPLADAGFQVRVTVPTDETADVEVVVSRRAGNAIQLPDRVGPSAGTLDLSKMGGRLTWRARMGEGTSGFRFDRGASSALYADTPLDFNVRIDGRAARPQDVVLGARRTHPESVPFVYEVVGLPGETQEKPALAVEEAPALVAPAGGRPKVQIWRTLSAAPLTTAGVPMDPAARERLRALGYVE